MIMGYVMGRDIVPLMISYDHYNFMVDHIIKEDKLLNLRNLNDFAFWCI